ncbi:hypothetical protein ATE67_19535 [Sphingopyxis sp. H050]|uniref:hypothetical protein n=1 Tax=unclassified Sphingopyxis TaxID=2614943 RepID=UPI000736557F|nr:MULTISPECIES: hypothetical protein [unclassified Sphingopyxis]KTE05764.1 hypothetical protein ATE76_20245 [Sphingopyxis sp. H093]KTE12106.1 hypothetical protein ATE71_11065 [Sphingopyxis sp. H115]KTE18157.1 hypothetical protein ATE67_19535 [Sphingopyxis sp. H050]KTE63781.1 hypothetical protein ATE74_18560 [Sphingopyxis sp. H085]
MAPVDRLGGAIFVLFLASQVGMIIIVNSYFAEFGPAGRFALMFAFFKAVAICMILFASMAGGAMALRSVRSRRAQILEIGNGRS